MAAAPPRDITYAQDFDELWETLRDRYAFFADKATDWGRVRQLYRPRVAEIGGWLPVTTSSPQASPN